MDTTSSALARTFWVLAQNQDAQNKLRLEIREARKDGNDLTYDELDKLPYLDAICRETLHLLVFFAFQELLLTKELQISSCNDSYTDVSFPFLQHSDDPLMSYIPQCSAGGYSSSRNSDQGSGWKRNFRDSYPKRGRFEHQYLGLQPQP